MNNAVSSLPNTLSHSAAIEARSARTVAAPTHTYSPSRMRMPSVGLPPSTNNSRGNSQQNFSRIPNQNVSDEHLNRMEMGYLTSNPSHSLGNGTTENLTSDSRENLNQIETGNSASNEMTGSNPTSQHTRIAKYILIGSLVSSAGLGLAAAGYFLGMKHENDDRGDNFLDRAAAAKLAEGPAKVMLAGMGVVGLGIVIALWPCLPKPVRNCLENCGSGC